MLSPADWPASNTDPAWPSLDQAVEQLAQADGPADESGAWPERLWQILQVLDAPSWSVPANDLKNNGDRGMFLQRYGRIAEGSLVLGPALEEAAT